MAKTIAAVMNCCQPWLKYLKAKTATTLATMNITNSTGPLLAKISRGISETTQMGMFILFLKNASRYRAVKVNGTIYRNFGANLLTASVTMTQIRKMSARYQNLLVSFRIHLLRK